MTSEKTLKEDTLGLRPDLHCFDQLTIHNQKSQPPQVGVCSWQEDWPPSLPGLTITQLKSSQASDHLNTIIDAWQGYHTRYNANLLSAKPIEIRESCCHWHHC